MAKMEKHLEFIQTTITRMAQNSFVIKGWVITLVSAMFALAAKDANHKYAVIAYFPTLVFWLLDSYYLYQERLFRKLYDKVRVKTEPDYSMDTSGCDNGISDWAGAALSKTILLFYGIMGLVIFIVIQYLK